MRAECAFGETDARAIHSSCTYPFNENSNRPFRGNYLNDRNRVIHANFFLLFFFFFFSFPMVACSHCSRRAKLREIFFHFREETLSSGTMPFHVSPLVPRIFQHSPSPRNFISSNCPTSIQSNPLSKKPSLESIRGSVPFLFFFLPIF